jgi:nitroreductase
MQNFMDIIRDRRSIRKYEEKEIPENVLNTVLETVRWSPSWANTQCWEIIVVRNAEVKARLQETIVAKNPATRAITGAPVVIALCGRTKSSGYYNDIVTTKFGDWFMYDLGLVTQTLCLTAHQQGLGTVIVGLLEHDKAAAVLDVPEGYELVTLIPMGYPAKISKAPDRKGVQDFVHYDRFGNKG